LYRDQSNKLRINSINGPDEVTIKGAFQFKKMNLELTKVDPEKYGIDKKEASEMLLSLNQLKSEKEVLREQYNDIINLDIDEPKTWKLASDLWSKIRDNRTKGIEVWRKNKKEFFLRGGQFVDATAKVEIEDNQRMEDNLELIKKRKELLEAQRIQDLKNERWGKIKEYTDVEPVGLGTMDDEMFEIVNSGLKQKHHEKIEAQKEAERLRIEQEEKEKAERERIRLENEALQAQIKKEREEAERKQKEIEEKAKKEREEIERLAAIERQKQAEILAKKEAELKAIKDAEIKTENERLAKLEAEKKEAEKLAKAPIKKQLNSWVESFEISKFSSENQTAKEIEEKFNSFKVWAKSEISKL